MKAKKFIFLLILSALLTYGCKLLFDASWGFLYILFLLQFLALDIISKK